MRDLLRRLFRRRKGIQLDRCSPEELRFIQQESEHLEHALSAKAGILDTADLVRLRRLARLLHDVNRRG